MLATVPVLRMTLCFHTVGSMMRHVEFIAKRQERNSRYNCIRLGAKSVIYDCFAVHFNAIHYTPLPRAFVLPTLPLFFYVFMSLH